MSETRLRTRVYTFCYGLVALWALILATQNLRYGLYSLFFAALLLGAVGLAGMATSWLQKRINLPKKTHLIILSSMAVLALGATAGHPDSAAHWLYPLLLLNLLILPLQQGLVLGGLIIGAGGLIMFVTGTFTHAIQHAVAQLLLLGLSSFYAHRYHHHVQSLADLTLHDAVTGSYNLRYFDEILHKEISRSEVTGYPLSLLHLSIDFFSELKDLRDSTSINSLLRSISEQLDLTIRAGDSHYYSGEGEFLLLMTFTPEEGMHVISERLRRLIEEHRWPGPANLTASIGCTTRQSGETAPNILLSRLRSALEEARRRGHNKVCHLRAVP